LIRQGFNINKSIPFKIDFTDGKRAESPCVSQPLSSGQTGTNMNILIAEDDSISRVLLKKILEKFGYTVIQATDGLMAWDLFKKHQPSVVITDWMMPEMDGITLCQKIRKEAVSKYVYIIIVTAKDNKTDAIKGLEAGADDYIVKPFSPDEIRARIRSSERIVQLENNYKKASLQLLQSEKMASVGQLAAGVAHEINNPTGFVSSNLKTLSDYQADVIQLIDMYRQLLEKIEPSYNHPENKDALLEEIEKIKAFEKNIDITFIQNDFSNLINDCREGMDRIKKIVIDLKDFAHPGSDTMSMADINAGIDSTLNMLSNEIKYKAIVKKDFGELPLINCFPQQLNQVFMNIIVNAAHAIKEKGEITVATKLIDSNIVVTIQDNGCGIQKENLIKIFDPFFTTKEIGKGTGLGLNVAYNIIKKHNGIIEVHSEEGTGTKFLIKIPVQTESNSNP
jgi:two-component system, NtrC family, sensor kinase